MKRKSAAKQSTPRSRVAGTPSPPWDEPYCSGELFERIYGELRRVASLHMGRERPDHTLQTTALVHEAYVRLVQYGRDSWSSPGEFFRAAAEAMRRILVDRARQRLSSRRGGYKRREPLQPDEVMLEHRIDDLIALNTALLRLRDERADLADVVSLRYFAGLTVEQTAEALDVSPSTVKRRWQMARAQLFDEIYGRDIIT